MLHTQQYLVKIFTVSNLMPLKGTEEKKDIFVVLNILTFFTFSGLLVPVNSSYHWVSFLYLSSALLSATSFVLLIANMIDPKYNLYILFSIVALQIS